MKECNVAFAGGSCGMAMIRAGEKLKDRCAAEGLHIAVHYVDLWVSDTLRPSIKLVIEMFPYYRNLAIPVINGRPFLIRQGEAALLDQLVAQLRTIAAEE